MKDRVIIRKAHKAIIEHGPVFVDELYEHHPEELEEVSTKRLEEVLTRSKKFTRDHTMRWHLKTYTKRNSDQERHFPPDVESLPDMHPFYKELADLVDEHAEDSEERYRFLCACMSFGEYWKSDPGGW